MADNKRAVGSVTYRDAEHGYFERRKLRRHAAFWSLWALGVGAVISGDFYGWNLGLDAGGFGGLLIAGIVITVMYYGLCYSIAEMSPALPHTGGAYSFSRSAMGPWGGFITGLGREHGIRHHPGGRRGRDGVPLARHRFRPDWSRRLVEQPCSLVGDLLHHLRRDQHHGHRDHHAVHRGDHRPGARRTRLLLPRSCLHGVVRRQPAHQHPTGGRRQQLPAQGHRRYLPRPALRDLVLPGDRGTAAGRRGITRSEAGHPPCHDLGAQHTGPLRCSHPVPEHGCGWRSRDDRNVGDPAGRWLQGDLRGGHGGVAALADRVDRVYRQLLHDHLCLRPKHLLAVPRGILPARVCRSPTRPDTRRTSR